MLYGARRSRSRPSARTGSGRSPAHESGYGRLRAWQQGAENASSLLRRWRTPRCRVARPAWRGMHARGGALGAAQGEACIALCNGLGRGCWQVYGLGTTTAGRVPVTSLTPPLGECPDTPWERTGTYAHKSGVFRSGACVHTVHMGRSGGGAPTATLGIGPVRRGGICEA